MAMALQKLYPEAQTTIGPWIERGFYYDFDLSTPLSAADLKAVKKEMVKIIKANLPFVCEVVHLAALSPLVADIAAAAPAGMKCRQRAAALPHRYRQPADPVS
jgi:threonyl-tRNA synthetase